MPHAGALVRLDVLAGALVAVAVLAVAAAFGVWRRLTDGRIRGVKAPSGADADAGPGAAVPEHDSLRIGAADLGGQLGDRATLVQFSTAFCQPCRSVRRILSEVAAEVTGVRHVEIDAEHHLDLVRRLDVFRTPTVFVLDSRGTVVRKAVGTPRKADVIAALGEAI